RVGFARSQGVGPCGTWLRPPRLLEPSAHLQWLTSMQGRVRSLAGRRPLRDLAAPASLTRTLRPPPVADQHAGSRSLARSASAPAGLGCARLAYSNPPPTSSG